MPERSLGIVLGQSRDRETGILAPATVGPVSAATRNSTAARSCPSDAAWLIAAARARWSRSRSRSTPCSCNLPSNCDPEAEILQGDGLGHDDRGDKERIGRLRFDSREFSGQNLGQLGGCLGVVRDVEPFDDVDPVFADRDADRPPERSSWLGAAGRWQVSLDNGAALRRDS